MAMQTALVYGRFLFSHARQIVAPFCTRRKQPRLDLVTGFCGFSKDFQAHHNTRKFDFGEDAFFIAGNNSSSALGVADGVGGWREYGIDSSLFSRALMKNCERFVVQGGLQPPTPHNIIKAAYQSLSEHKAPLFGSSTACIIMLDKETHMLSSANLGDSGFLVIRGGSVVHQSTEQQHYFNTPFQLALPPPDQEGVCIQDSLDEAERLSFCVNEGDIIVMGTDGLFDNLSIPQILQEVAVLKEGNDSVDVQSVANSLAKRAQILAFDPNYLSPFAIQANEIGLEIIGGKPDDITVMIAQVVCDNRMEVKMEVS